MWKDPTGFIFANLNGTISAWDTGPTAFIQVTTPGAVYTGLAINGAQTRLYAANGAGTGGVDVFDSTFAPLSLAADAFVDPSLPTPLARMQGAAGRSRSSGVNQFGRSTPVSNSDSARITR